MKKKITNAYKYASHQRMVLTRWACFHVLALTLYFIGLYFAFKYMNMPDRVLVLGMSKNIFAGNSESLISKRVVSLISYKAAYALLNRRYDYTNKKHLSLIFSKKAMNQVNFYLNKNQKFFKEREIVQHLEVERFKYINNGHNQFKALLQGYVYRKGQYFGHPYQNKLEFALTIALKKTDIITRLPLEVTKLRYEEWEIFNDK